MKENFQFCVKCGNSTVKNSNNLSSPPDGPAPTATSGNGVGCHTTASPTASVKSIETFDTFMEKKKDERASHFKKTSKNKTSPSDLPVTINIGIMRYAEEEVLLKPIRGKTLPLIVKKTADSDEVLRRAVGKHSMHNTNEISNNSSSHYKLLYPDGIEVKTLKETEEVFTVKGYKTELGKPYNRVTLYVCYTPDYLCYSIKSVVGNLSSTDDDTENNNDVQQPCQPREQTQSNIKNYTDSYTGECKPKKFCPETSTCTLTSTPASNITCTLVSSTVTRPVLSGISVTISHIDNDSDTHASLNHSISNSTSATGNNLFIYMK